MTVQDRCPLGIGEGERVPRLRLPQDRGLAESRVISELQAGDRSVQEGLRQPQRQPPASPISPFKVLPIVASRRRILIRQPSHLTQSNHTRIASSSPQGDVISGSHLVQIAGDRPGIERRSRVLPEEVVHSPSPRVPLATASAPSGLRSSKHSATLLNKLQSAARRPRASSRSPPTPSPRPLNDRARHQIRSLGAARSQRRAVKATQVGWVHR